MSCPLRPRTAGGALNSFLVFRDPQDDEKSSEIVSLGAPFFRFLGNWRDRFTAKVGPSPHPVASFFACEHLRQAMSYAEVPLWRVTPASEALL